MSKNLIKYDIIFVYGSDDMNILSVLIGKIVIVLGKILKRGSSLPGMVTLKINKNIFKYFKLPNKVIAVTGSSGKGSTSSTIASILRQNGYKVAHNSAGSNLMHGILTLLLENTKLNGKIDADILVYEIDERYTKYVFDKVKPDYVVITNITRDQPPRQGNPDIVADAIKDGLTDEMHLILNGDDPILRQFINKNKVTYYGIDKNKYSYKISKFQSLNTAYCPKCHSKLEYNYYHFEDSGDYYCSSCDFKRPNIDYLVEKVNYNKSTIQINGINMSIPYNILFAVNNIAASYTTCSLLGLKGEDIASSIDKIYGNDKIFNIYPYKERIITVLNNKNENSSTFNQSLLYVSRFKEKKVIIIGWKEISRRYNFDDLSWLYDIDFEILKEDEIEKIICVGLNRYDIATRLKYAGYEKKIVVCSNLVEATNYIKDKTKSNIYAIVNFDYVKPFNELMNEGE